MGKKLRKLSVEVCREENGWFGTYKPKEGVCSSYGKTLKEFKEKMTIALEEYLKPKSIKDYHIRWCYNDVKWHTMENMPEEGEHLLVRDDDEKIHEVKLENYYWISIEENQPLLITVNKWLYYNK